MELSVASPTFTKKNIGSMGQRYPYPTICDTNVEPIIHIYGARAIFLIFIDNQDTKYESQDI